MSGDPRRQEWQEVTSRKIKKDSHSDASNNKVIIKFFVANLPPKCSSSDLKEVFGGFGGYEGSYIARKLDRWGKRFGFISFKDVNDVKRMEGEMADVWLGSYKLFVTQARFVDGAVLDKEVVDPKGKKTSNDQHVHHANPSAGGATASEVRTDDRGGFNEVEGCGRSFLDSVLNRNKVDMISVDDNVEGYGHWKGVTLVGKVIDFSTLTSLKKLLRSKDWRNVNIKYVGGFSVLLFFDTVEEADRFLDNSEVWSLWFVSLTKWGDKFKEMERIAWLQIHGVPTQLAIDQVLDVIGNRYGRVVQPANMSAEDNNFSFFYIGVLTKLCRRIYDRVDLSWRGLSFNVWIDEDVGEWVPDCVENFDEEESFDDLSSNSNEEEGEFYNDNPNNDAVEVEMGDIPVNEGVEDIALVPKVGDCDIQNSLESPINIVGVSKEESTMVRKKFRRRQLFKNRGESSGSQERPKKRQRDDNDPFCLDKLIGIMSNHTQPQEVFVDSDNGCSNEFITPDLNAQVNSCDAGPNSDEREVNAYIDPQQDSVIEKASFLDEVSRTCEVGNILGVEEIENFTSEVHQILRSEGYQGGDQ